MDTELATNALKALAHETRLRIFRRLVQAGPAGLCVADLAAHLQTEANGSFSFHLKELSNAGLICSRQASRFIYYSANYPAMNALLGFLTEHCCAGEPCGESAHTCVTEIDHH
ncbi:MAG: helix-turn-helix transcriptional regulator [Dechloromonas sp.]|nr:MAG: helix-turn-helix transcriptional regulator [Dechloromonas sp.]